MPELENTQFGFEKIHNCCPRKVAIVSIFSGFVMAYIFLDKKNKEILVDQFNYTYKIGSNRGNKYYWRCTEQFKSKCKGSTITDGKNNPQPALPGNHNHPARIASVEFLKAESDLMKRARENPTLPPRVLLGDVSNTLAQKDVRLPKTGEALAKSIRRHRQSSGGFPKAPANFEDVLILLPEQFRLTKSRDRFLRFADKVDETEDPTMLVFMSPTGKELLRAADIWYSDGTFITAPFPYAQVLIFHEFSKYNIHYVFTICLIN